MSKFLLLAIKYFAVPIPLVSFAIFLWREFKTFHVFIYFGLAIVIWMLGFTVWKLTRDIRLRNSVVFDLDIIETYYGLYFFMKKDGLADDNTHRYILKEWIFNIVDRDCEFTINLKGRNVLEQPSRYVPLKVCGCVPMQINEMGVQLFDNHNREQLPPPTIVLDDPFVKIFHLYFRKPLAREDYFDLRFKCRWEALFSREHAYAIMSSYNQKLGCNQVLFKFFLDSPYGHYEVLRLERHHFILTSEKLNESADRRSLVWQKSNLPGEKVYLLNFSRE